MPTQKKGKKCVCFEVIDTNLNSKGKTICDQSTSAGSYRVCLLKIFFCPSIFSVCVCVVYWVCYISIICWWIQKSGIHVDGNFWIYLFFFCFSFLTLRFYVYSTVVQLLATLGFRSDPIRVRSDTAYATHGKKPTRFFSCIRLDYGRQSWKSRIDIPILRVKLIVSNGARREFQFLYHHLWRQWKTAKADRIESGVPIICGTVPISNTCVENDALQVPLLLFFFLPDLTIITPDGKFSPRSVPFVGVGKDFARPKFDALKKKKKNR